MEDVIGYEPDREVLEDEKMVDIVDTAEDVVLAHEHESTSLTNIGQWGRWAIIFGYIGESYQGLQKNPGAKTIEEALETALYQAGIIDASDYGTLSKVGWNRAARTDKGVHAAGQVISLMLRLREGETEDDLRIRTNNALPNEIRVFDFVRVTKQFNAKNLCSGRRYGYVLPTFTLRPISAFASNDYVQKHKGVPTIFVESVVDEYMTGVAFERARQHMFKNKVAFHTSSSSSSLTIETAIIQSQSRAHQHINQSNNISLQTNLPDMYQTGAAFVTSQIARKLFKEKDSKSRVSGDGFRLRTSEWETLRDVLQRFCGTHSFHNFTPRLEAGDATTVRYITECVPSRPFLVGEGTNVMEFVHVTIQGQSFLLNQIRHMIGLTIDRVRGQCGASVMDLAFSGGSFKLPLAPAEGLYLGQCFFVAYDRRYGKDHQSMTVLRPPAADRMSNFMENVIWRHIGKSVLGEKRPFHEYMEEMRINPMNYKFRPPPPNQIKALERFQAQQARKQARHEYYHGADGSNPLEKPAFDWKQTESSSSGSALNSIVFQPAVILHSGPVSKQAKEKSEWKKKLKQEKMDARVSGTKRDRFEDEDVDNRDSKETRLMDLVTREDEQSSKIVKLSLDSQDLLNVETTNVSSGSGRSDRGESVWRGRGRGGGGRGGGGRGGGGGGGGGGGRGGGTISSSNSTSLQTWRPGQTTQPSFWKSK